MATIDVDTVYNTLIALSLATAFGCAGLVGLGWWFSKMRVQDRKGRRA
jgi:hypothetical protein